MIFDAIRTRILADREAGSSRTLAEYARLFPGQDALVARAYADLCDDGAVSPTSSDRDSIAHYKTLKELGRGGQGVVYLAEDTRLHRKVALKVLTGLGPGSEDSVHRLRREAEVASKLQHPGICGVHDAGVASGTPYIAMHYVEGTTLADRIAETKSATSTTTKQQITEILRVFEKAAQALHAAHEAGIVHRDIKPGNIMVNASGQPVILDFGLARAEDMDLQTLTRTGDVFGTPAYMSPEQISGQRIRLDRRSDVYSLGVTLYECLTLRRPFEAPTREGVYQAVMTKSPPDPRKINPAISKDLKVVIETALEKDRDRRYATADALAKDLQAVIEGRPIQARPVGPVGRFVRWSKREPAKAALLGVVLVALPVIATLVTSKIKDGPQVEAARLARIERDKDEILSEASFEVSEGDPKKAVDLYMRVLEMEGTSPEAAGGLVLAQLKLKNASVALQILDQHRPLLGEGPAASLLRAQVLAALNKKDEAAAIEKHAPAPQSAFEHHLLAQKELQLGQGGDASAFGRALHHVTTAILLSPAPRISLHSLRAQAAGQAMDREAAMTTADALQRRWPDSAVALHWRAFALEALGDPTLLDEALAASREAIRLEPDLAIAHATLGVILRAKGQVDDAITAYREAIRLSPHAGWVHFNLGQALGDRELRDDAMAAYREAIRLDPNDVEALCNLANILQAKGRPDEALALCREAVRLRPTESMCHVALAFALNEKNEVVEAIAENREAIRLKPDSALAHFNLGQVFLKKGLADEAIAAYREAIRHDPGHRQAYYNLGNLLRERGLLDDAIAAYREVVRIAPDFAEGHCNLGVSLLQLGSPREALPELRRGHEIGSKRPGWPYASQEWVEAADQSAAEEERLEASLAAHVAAGTQPEAAAELAALARVALQKGHPLLAARWFQTAFSEASDTQAGHQRLAARAAVLASISGTDGTARLDDAARTSWRTQALSWLESEALLITKSSQAKAARPEDIRLAIVPLTRSPDLASVRGADAIAKLPSSEQPRWTKLWADIDALLASLDRKPESRTAETRR